jgi:protein-S-isoprenylcysteine O-methyltransferase Ste14
MTGPYRLVRHPIYLGMSMMAAGQAIAFNSGPGFLVVVVGVIPSFLWRAREEEALLATFFGDRYPHYRKRTSMIIPYVL